MQYLGDEALAAQPADVRAFLLRTSLLDRMCAPLCDALTGRADGRAMLERLARANLFVVALDDEGRWYRYYHLFADLLRHHLGEESPELVPELHRCAARWLEADGRVTEAAHHLFAIPDFSAAADLVARITDELFRSGDLATMLGLLEQFPEEALEERPALALTRAEASFAHGQLSAASRHITTAENAVARMHPKNDEQRAQQRQFIGRIAADRAVLSSMHGDVDATLAYINVVQEYLPEEDSLGRGGADIAVGHAWRLKGDLEAADAAYAEAMRRSSAAGSPFLAALAIDMRTLVANARGQLHLSANLSRQIIAMAESRGAAARSLASNAWTNLGWRLYEWNDLDGAEEALHKALVLAEQWGDTEVQVDGQLWLSLVCQARGQDEQARVSLQLARDNLEAVEREGQSFPWLPPLVIATSARIAAAQSRLAEAERWMAELRREHGSNATIHPLVELVSARVLLARGDTAEVKTLLEGLLPEISAHGQMAYEIEMRMLLALAYQAAGETEQALDSLAQAITQGMSEGYIRLFLDEGGPMIALLMQLREQRLAQKDVAGYCTKLLVLAGAETYETYPASSQPQAQAPTHPDLPEPLSAREMEVLGLLAEGYSNQDIADHLVVALSTVKTHVHHLYAKLQTPDRLRAVTRARALGLLNDNGDGRAVARQGRLT
jgi:LuxR family maltose regulon positive regulatory protein